MTEREIFIAALQKEDPAARQAYLEEACTGQPELRRQVENLLGLYAGAGSFLDKPAAESPATDAFQDIAGPISSPEAAGATIGPYKLIELIGEGGMGTVWMAQQTEPVKRMVAVKLIKAGMDSKQVLARFEAERQALALMDHPNIARVLDARTTNSGRPYFVMDLVKGAPITKYCDEHRLMPRQRLELFIPVCQAVQHAHQKGVIHRDLKPSNVLVAPYDGRPVPKVIDFGVAKAVGQQLTDQTLVTGFGTLVGTPEYMSPEQAELNNRDIDTRSDIYALGVLLYELLTGVPPFSRKELEHAGMLEMLRVIREQEPCKPSTRLSTADGLPSLAASRGTDPKGLATLVRGELDWIVMKALEKDRTRRYETANGFVRDIERYLADEPVEACPPSAVYRLRKFMRRNKGRLGMAALVLMLLVVSGISVGWGVRDRSAREAEKARQQEERQAKVAGQVASILAEVDRLEKEQKWPEALLAARQAEAAMAGGEADPATLARVDERIRDLEFIGRLERIRTQEVARVYSRSSIRGSSEAYAQAFREYGVDIDELPVERSIDLLKRRPALAIVLAAALDDWSSVWPQGSEASVAGWKRLMAVARGIDPEPMRDRLRAAQGQPVANVRDDLRRLAGSIDVRAQHPATLILLARGLQRVQHWDSAIRTLRLAQYIYPGDFSLNSELGLDLWMRNNFEGAVRFWTAAVAIRPRSAVAYSNLGSALHDQKKLPEAIIAFRKAIELDTNFALPYYNLGIALSDQEKLPEAIKAYRKAIELDPKYAAAYNNLGLALRRQKNLREAIAAFRKAIELDKNVAIPHYNLGLAFGDQEKLPEAIEAYRNAIELDPKYTAAYSNLGNALSDQKKLPEAIAYYKKAVELDPSFAPAWEGLTAAERLLVSSHASQGRSADALRIIDELLANVDRPGGSLQNGSITVATCIRQFQTLGDVASCRAAAAALEKKNPADAGILYNIACCRAMTAAAQLQAGVADAARLAKGDADLAMAGLARAVGAGFADLSLLHQDADLDPLRDREDFRKLLADVEAKAPPLALARSYVLLSQWEKAAANYAKADPLARPLQDDAFACACLLLIRGDNEGYNHFCRGMIQRATQTETVSPGEGYVLARTCAMARNSPVDPARSVRWANQAVASTHSPWDYHVLGLAQYRAGQFDQALHSLTKANVMAWKYRDLNWFGLAMAQHRLGHYDEARESLAKGVKWLEQEGPPGPGRPAKIMPQDWLEAQLLRREAEGMLNMKRSP
jgi:serine/threonine protein kinase/tetratricopeptide (TPR) repeat protein